MQNLFLLIASYYFYSCWDWRFLFLLAFSTLLDYYTGLRIFSASGKRHKKIWLFTSIIINVGFLAVFKYYDFFAQSFSEFLSRFDIHSSPAVLGFILPVGISFYTFHGISYIIDIYYERIKPETNIVTYSLFVSFFPLLVAGPIERATHLLPQLNKQRVFSFNEATTGLKQILWGVFKKVVIADGCAEFANTIFNNYSEYNGSTLFLGAFLFAFQIYGDFSGYSDIALGSAKLFGIDLLRNFAFPYFSRDIAEFWRRWHISLSSWFKDYVYIPLGGSKGNMLKNVRNIFIIFLISGLWHGANWTFMAWGVLNALYFLPLLLLNKNRTHIEIVAKGKYFPNVKEFLSMIFTFILVTIAWVFFRSNSITDALLYLNGMNNFSFFQKPSILPYYLIIPFFIFILLEWIGREGQFALENIGEKWPRALRWFFYSFILFLIGMYMNNNGSQFIYFQF